MLRKDGTFGPGKVIEALHSPGEDIMPNVRKRELGGYEMVFSSNRGNAAATDQDVYISFAWFLPGPWTKPVKLGSNVNTVRRRGAARDAVTRRQAVVLRPRRRHLCQPSEVTSRRCARAELPGRC